MWTTRNGYPQGSTSPTSGEEESGRGTAVALVKITNWLIHQSGLREDDPRIREIIRVGREQYDRNCNPVPRIPDPPGRLNKPDISYIARDGTRVNIEMDTDVSSSCRHEEIVNRRDPAAHNFYLLIHPWTGAVLSARERNPSKSCTKKYEGCGPLETKNPSLVPAKKAKEGPLVTSNSCLILNFQFSNLPIPSQTPCVRPKRPKGSRKQPEFEAALIRAAAEMEF